MAIDDGADPGLLEQLGSPGPDQDPDLMFVGLGLGGECLDPSGPGLQAGHGGGGLEVVAGPGRAGAQGGGLGDQGIGLEPP